MKRILLNKVDIIQPYSKPTSCPLATSVNRRLRDGFSTSCGGGGLTIYKGRPYGDQVAMFRYNEDSFHDRLLKAKEENKGFTVTLNKHIPTKLLKKRVRK